MVANGIGRRAALGTGVAAALGALPLVNVRGQAAAGRLSVGFWDHWVPAGNDAMRALINRWAAQNHVEVAVDFITSVGNKNLLTIAAESQARTGHDALAFPTWEIHAQQRLLEPMDDVVGRLAAKYGALSPINEYLAKIEGHWRAVPSISGSQNKPCLARMDLLQQHAGLDIRGMWPANATPSAAQDGWTWDAFLRAAEACQRGGVPFGLPLGSFTDATDWVGALFASHGAALADAQGHPTVRTDAVRAVLDYAKRLTQWLPRDVFSWDDASNNRAMISGQSALIFNPPSPWAVAKRDAPAVAAQLWQAPNPAGPAGRFLPYLPYFWGVWSFARNKGAAKALIEWLSEREQAQALTTAVNGYDIPPFDSMNDFPVWTEEGPPTGVVYNYPIRPHHKARQSIADAPAPPEMAVQMYNSGVQAKMIARVAQNNEPIERTLSWAEGELAGFMR